MDKFYLNKGLKAHIWASLLFIIPMVLFFYKNTEVMEWQRYLFMYVYFAVHCIIALISYLSGWYDDEDPHSEYDDEFIDEANEFDR